MIVIAALLASVILSIPISYGVLGITRLFEIT